MLRIVRLFLDQCKTGFTLQQKLLFSALLIFYVPLPIDLLPDFLPPLTYADDGLAIWLLVKLLRAPTLPPTSGGLFPSAL